MRQAWKLVISEGDNGWIRRRENIDPKGPGGAIVSALNRLKACGVDETDVTNLVRVMQFELLFGLCYLLDDPGDREPEVKDITWRLFQVDEKGRPIEVIACLHEDVLATEPGGREMRPR